MKIFLKSTWATFLALTLMLGSGSFLNRVSAVTGSDWQAGRIADDSVFFNPGTMNTGDIQNFLNSKVPSCDTNGDKPYPGYANRREYAATRGYFPPFTCLKDYRQDTPSKSAETSLCNGYSGANESAAEIIYKVSQSCGINPMALIVLLQKEQSLVTDDWPWTIQYRSATGYGCPDGAPCDAEYYGFFNQVYAAARQFKNYAKNPLNYNHRAGRDNNVRFHPNAACGSSTVFITNQATAGLYNYTPYQPNQAALNNLYGLGDSCSAYGNRNFWRLFNDWFGRTTGLPPYINAVHPDGTLVKPANGSHVYLMKDGKAQSTTSLAVFQSWGFDFGRVKIATQKDLDLMAASDADTDHSHNPAPLELRESTLVKGSGPTVYVIQKSGGINQKRSLESLENFERLSYTFNEVMVMPDSELNAIPTGSPYGMSEQTHPNLSLVRAANETTVYIIIGGERHSLTSLPIFISHRLKFANVKTATAADNALPITWPVTWYGEGALVKGTSGPNVYIIDSDTSGVNTTRRFFVNYWNFVGLDYNFGEVMTVADATIPPEGTPVGQ